jgi:arginase/N-omega-hydroxy-L-arginine amidinohydrolase
MTFNLIVSRGRAADKTTRTIAGAAQTALALKAAYGVTPEWIGEPSPPTEDDWSTSLPQAKPTLEAITDAIERSVTSGRLTVLASNTCSISLGSLPVVARHHPDAVLLWIDAHGDFNTPATSDTGYLGGMVVAGVCGLWDSGHGSGFDPSNVVLVGARDLDPLEQGLIDQAGVTVIPPNQVTPATVLAAVRGRKVWVHIDWDVLEPGYVPADYKVSGGLLPQTVQAVLAALPHDSILGLEVAEYQVPPDAVMASAAVSTILATIGPILTQRHADAA